MIFETSKTTIFEQEIEQEFGSAENIQETNAPYYYIAKLEKSDNLCVVVHNDKEMEFADLYNIEKSDTDKLCYYNNVTATESKFPIEFNCFTVSLIPKSNFAEEKKYVTCNVKISNKLVKFIEKGGKGKSDTELLEMSSSIFSECILDAITHGKICYDDDENNYKKIKICFSLQMIEKYDIELRLKLASREVGPNDYNKEIYKRQKELKNYLAQNISFLSEKERKHIADECTYNKLNMFFQEKINVLTQEKLELQSNNFDLRSKLKTCESNLNSVKKESENCLINIKQLQSNIEILMSKLQTSETNYVLIKKENEKCLITIAELKNDINLLEKENLELKQMKNTKETEETEEMTNIEETTNIEEIDDTEEIEEVESPEITKKLETLFNFINYLKYNSDEVEFCFEETTINDFLNYNNSDFKTTKKLEILNKLIVHIYNSISEFTKRHSDEDSLTVLNNITNNMCKAKEILELVETFKNNFDENAKRIILNDLGILFNKTLTEEEQQKYIGTHVLSKTIESIHFLSLLSFINLNILKYEYVNPIKLIVMKEFLNSGEQINSLCNNDDSDDDFDALLFSKHIYNAMFFDDTSIIEFVRKTQIGNRNEISDLEILIQINYFELVYKIYSFDESLIKEIIKFFEKTNKLNTTILDCCRDLLEVKNLTFKNKKSLEKFIGSDDTDISTIAKEINNNINTLLKIWNR